MRKLGFTLAEVLITLGIIGIVAVLTLPTLLSDYEKQQTATALAKAINTLENANQTLLQEYNVNDLSKVDSRYIPDALEKAVKLAVSADGSGYYSTKDGIAFNQRSNWASYRNDASYKRDLRERKFGEEYVEVDIDINGAKGKNTMGSDRFKVWVDSRGNVMPFGGSLYSSYLNAGDTAYGAEYNTTWRRYCNESTVTNPSYCAGSIVDHGYKIEYKF